ncbi:MAG: hypothetical protein LBL79_02100, partial [Prevotella sp.]|nr:hypothetical protein [Prevotella sp.]
MSKLDKQFTDGATLYAAELNELVDAINEIDESNEEKVNKIQGKELSTNDFTDELKERLTALPEFEKDGAGNMYLSDDGTYKKIEAASGGLVNVSNDNNTYNYAAKQTARNAVLTKDRIKGQVITYRLNTGEWVLDLFTGDSVGLWSDAANWKSYLVSSDLAGILADIEALKNKVTVTDNRTQNIPD